MKISLMGHKNLAGGVCARSLAGISEGVMGSELKVLNIQMWGIEDLVKEQVLGIPCTVVSLYKPGWLWALVCCWGCRRSQV